MSGLGEEEEPRLRPRVLARAAGEAGLPFIEGRRQPAVGAQGGGAGGRPRATLLGWGEQAAYSFLGKGGRGPGAPGLEPGFKCSASSFLHTRSPSQVGSLIRPSGSAKEAPVKQEGRPAGIVGLRLAGPKACRKDTYPSFLFVLLAEAYGKIT